jgi:Tfp pilus assembly protein PilN
MRAVNLIPSDERPGAGGLAGRSGGAVYILLGVLALAVVMLGAYTKVNHDIKSKEAQVAELERAAAEAESRARSLAAYTRFAELRAKRVQTVKQLAASRFDWAHALNEVSRVIPSNAWLTQLTATTSPDITSKVGGGGNTAGMRGRLPVPAIELTGCTTGQAQVARMLARLRMIDGVQRVSLVDARKPDQATSADSGTRGGDTCSVSEKFPTFNIVVFFKPQEDVTAAQPNGGATPAAAGGDQPADQSGGTSTSTGGTK